MSTPNTILEQFKGLSQEDLIKELMITKARLSIEKAQVNWLDRLADELRDGEDDEESSELYEEYKRIKEQKKELIKDLFDIHI